MSGAAMAIALAMRSRRRHWFSSPWQPWDTPPTRPAGQGGRWLFLIIAILAAEVGKLVSKETKVDLLVTPLVTILLGCALAMWWAPPIGAAASAVGSLINWATELQPFWMGILVSVLVGIALTLPISSAAICHA